MKLNSRVDLQDLLDTCQARAIEGKLIATEQSVYRSLCREYSVMFHTPLHVVLNDLDPEAVIQAVYEQQLSDADLEDQDTFSYLVDRINSIEDPNYDYYKEEELQSYIAKVEKEEKERIEAGLPMQLVGRKSKQKKTPEKQEPKKPERTSGSINLSYLENMDKGESGEF